MLEPETDSIERLRRGLSAAPFRLVAVALAGVLAYGMWPSQPRSEERFRFADHDSFRPVPVVMVVFDEFPLASILDRRGGVDQRLFPNLFRLARHSLWFKNAATPETFTKEALPALLTGSYPEPNAPPGMIYPRNLFTLLGRSHDIFAGESLPRLCPRQTCNSLSARNAALPDRFHSFASGERGSKFAAFLQAIEKRSEPAFYFVHMAMPHGPWRYLVSGQRYLEETPMPGETDPPGRGTGWARDRWLVAQAYQRHLLQARLTDQLVGALLARLQETAVYEDALVVVTADHGVAFTPGFPRRLVEGRTAGVLGGVPLFIKLPGQESGRERMEPVSTIDLVPTIADALKLSDAWPMDGVSLLGDVPSDRSRSLGKVHLGSNGAELFREAGQKYRLFGRREGVLNLYDLAPPGTSRLLDRPLTSTRITAPARATVAIEHWDRVIAAGPEDDLLPSLLQGTVTSGDLPRRSVLAIALNDRIVALTRTYSAQGTIRFQAMLPPDGFDRPPNVLQLFVVEDPASKRLAPLPSVPAAEE